MYHALMLMIILQICLAIPAKAENAEEFIRRVVQSDFVGNSDARLNHVELQQVDADNTEAPGVYFLTESPLVVVKSFDAIEFYSAGQAVCGTVRFEVVARSHGEGLPSWEKETSRSLVTAGFSDREEVEYCAFQKHGNWILKKPPLPRVSKEAITKELTEKYKRAEDKLGKVGNDDPRVFLNRTKVRDSIKQQLETVRDSR